MNFPENLSQKIKKRKQDNAFRTLSTPSNLIDFSSNDYLGFAKNETIFNQIHQYLIKQNLLINGSTGSRLLSGNHKLYQETETIIADFHRVESALIFNSGYQANVGFFSCVPQKSDIILYDELCHASIRDGFRLTTAKSYKFGHNDFEKLEQIIQKTVANNSQQTVIYVVTESVFSMDGDCPNLSELATICNRYHCKLVIDEAHALGVFGNKNHLGGQGLVQSLGLENDVFARIVTFGKGMGCHGAAILGSQDLIDYLVNFSRSFIYTTGLSPHAVATIRTAYLYLKKNHDTVAKLRQNIAYFNQQKTIFGLSPIFVKSKSAIQSAIISDNASVKSCAAFLQSKGYDVKPILSPTVPKGQERLRICLHNYNSEKEIFGLLQTLADGMFVSQNS